MWFFGRGKGKKPSNNDSFRITDRGEKSLEHCSADTIDAAVLVALQSGSHSPNSICREYRLPRNQVDDSIQRLIKQGKIESVRDEDY